MRAKQLKKARKVKGRRRGQVLHLVPVGLEPTTALPARQPQFMQWGAGLGGDV